MTESPKYPQYGARYRTVIKGGRLTCSQAGFVEDVRDVAIGHHGRIALIADQISAEDGMYCEWADGKDVIAGPIDAHTHFVGPSAWVDPSIIPDDLCLRRGTLTAADCGTAGRRQLEPVLKELSAPNIENRYHPELYTSRTRLVFGVNLAKRGLIAGLHGELLRETDIDDPQELAEFILRYPRYVKFVKVRAGRRQVGELEQGLRAVRAGKEAAKAAGVFVMVHIDEGPPSLRQLLDADILEAGDVITHCFRGPIGEHKAGQCFVSPEGEILQEVVDAIDAGISFDLGHGMGSFDFDICRESIADARKKGIKPFTSCSSDIHRLNQIAPVGSQLLCASKLLHVGDEFPEVVDSLTFGPAEMLGLHHEIGSLEEDKEGDILVLERQEIEDGLFFHDSNGKREKGEVLLSPIRVFKAGNVV